MDDKLLKVKVVFDKVREMRNEIGTLFEGLDGRITKLTEVYNDFIQNTKKIKTADTKIFIFSLDSFYFQNNLLKREYKYLTEYYNIIINRMYGEYYKLYKLITDYVVKSQVDGKMSETLKNKKYPKYDDLNEEKQYDFHLIVQLNEDIINIIAHLINILRDKEHELKSYITNQGYGLNVNNFVSTFNYEVIVLKEQIILYEKYLDFFYHIHEKLLKRLTTKISLLEAQLNADIKFEGGLIGKRKDNNSLMNDMNVKGMNKRAVRDLRRSIIGAKSPSNSSTDNDTDELEFSAIDHIPIHTEPLHFTSNPNFVPKSNRPIQNNSESLIQKMFPSSNENIEMLIHQREEQLDEQEEEEEEEEQLEEQLEEQEEEEEEQEQEYEQEYEEEQQEQQEKQEQEQEYEQEPEYEQEQEYEQEEQQQEEQQEEEEEDDILSSETNMSDDGVVREVLQECIDEIVEQDMASTPLTKNQKKNRKKNLKKKLSV